MGVAKTLPNYKSFTFDGTNSRNYGVYITGQGVFNAPERNVEMVEIPGRNGAYALDKGNFNNIEVTYPAGIFADTEADFAQAVSDLRNFLCSKSGYCRLEDDYNTGEYRMAVYKSGLDVDHDMLIAGEFNIVFECKPQRYLTSGETAVTVVSGSDITNPTLFASRPQLQVTGYGEININGQKIERYDNVPLGLITLVNDGSLDTNSFTIPSGLVNTGDTITISGIELVYFCNTGNDYFSGEPTMSITNTYIGADTKWITPPYESGGVNRNYFYAKTTLPPLSFTIGTTQSITNVTRIAGDVENGTYSIITLYTVMVSYYTNVGVSIQITTNGQTTHTGESVTTSVKMGESKHGTITANSSVSSTTNNTYIDLDIGECYIIKNDVAVSVNDQVSLPAELPTLPPGNTTISYDNTFTQLKVVPRWWKV